MSTPKGPKVELPEDLAQELERAEASAEQGGAEAASGDSEPAPPALVPRSELSALEMQLAEAQDKYLRLAAELENFRRRVLRERQELQLYATENLVKELLATVDNLERALEHARRAEEGGGGEKLLEGVELTYRSLMQALERVGVREVEAGGVPFDPQVHEAIRQVPTADHPSGSVVEVFQRGYLMHGRLLRPARVAVAVASGNPKP